MNAQVKNLNYCTGQTRVLKDLFGTAHIYGGTISILLKGVSPHQSPRPFTSFHHRKSTTEKQLYADVGFLCACTNLPKVTSEN